MDQINVFRNSEFGELSVLEIEGRPFFPATQCAKVLGYANPHKAIIDHCKGVTKREGVSITMNQHGVESKQTNAVNYIPEGDLYRLIVRSKLPSAEKFERWVFDEVLPELRKHGGYGDVGALIRAAVVEAVSETVRVIVPSIVSAMQSYTQKEEPEEEITSIVISQRRRNRKSSKVDKMPSALRNEIMRMLMGDEVTYKEIAEYAARQGYGVSQTALYRQREKAFKSGAAVNQY